MKKKTTKKTSAPRLGGPTLAPPASRTGLSLDLACGQSPCEGFQGVDIWPGAQHVLNLMQYPWPFADNSCSALHCSHFVEHIPTDFVDDYGAAVPMGTPGARDAFFRFFDECWRILEPGGTMKVIVPCARSSRAFQDPTHKRFIVGETFAYLSEEWRTFNKLDHYNVTANFRADVVHSYDSGLNARAPEVLQRMMNAEWNAILDFYATLIKLPKGAPVTTPAASPISIGR